MFGLFLLLTLGIAATWGLLPGIFAAVLTNLSLNYFFIEPLHRFSVHDSWNIIGLAVFLLVSVIGSSLVAAAQKAAAEAQRRQTLAGIFLTAVAGERMELAGRPGQAGEVAVRGVEMHVLLADRDDEMPHHREHAQVAGVVVDP